MGKVLLILLSLPRAMFYNCQSFWNMQLRMAEDAPATEIQCHVETKQGRFMNLQNTTSDSMAGTAI